MKTIVIGSREDFTAWHRSHPSHASLSLRHIPNVAAARGLGGAYLPHRIIELPSADPAAVRYLRVAGYQFPSEPKQRPPDLTEYSAEPAATMVQTSRVRDNAHRSRPLLSLVVIAGGFFLIVATNGGILLAAIVGLVAVVGGGFLWSAGHAVAERAIGDTSWKSVLIGIVIVLLGLLLISKGCHLSAPEDFDPSDYGGQLRR